MTSSFRAPCSRSGIDPQRPVGSRRFWKAEVLVARKGGCTHQETQQRTGNVWRRKPARTSVGRSLWPVAVRASIPRRRAHARTLSLPHDGEHRRGRIAPRTYSRMNRFSPATRSGDRPGASKQTIGWEVRAQASAPRRRPSCPTATTPADVADSWCPSGSAPPGRPYRPSRSQYRRSRSGHSGPER